MNGRSPLPAEHRRGSLTAWLRPGMGIKRWLLVVFLGQLLVALALALIIRQVYRDVPAGDPATGVLDLLSLQFLPLELRPLVLLGAGLLVFLFGAWRLLRVLLQPFRPRDEPLVEMLFRTRARARGPHVVAIGGGTGLSTLLRGLKELTSNITAVVTVADDGGSSGKLRLELGTPPMGDIRNCIAALADAEPAMARLLQYRFPKTAAQGDGLEGHAFGNLLIAAMTDIEGDFEEAVRQSNRVLAVRGKVVPAAPEPVTLHAELTGGEVIDGQSAIARASGIRRVWITPDDVPATSEAVAAIGSAELVVLGPGSLYTSVLPNLLVPGIRAALEKTTAPRLYVCNVATQVGETEGYSLADHLAALRAHGVDGLIDAVLANNNFSARAPERYPAAPVKVDLALRAGSRPLVLLRDLVDDGNAHHHDPHKLAASIVALYEERALPRAAAGRPA
ncbi:MAG TPA: gluconeogenesis factor YvcK family protein [Candidatus Limnocylindria bacterium]|nr:gluconeogenesis factor YvcK family protein [Candidatus Limnocylindria bacterium]